MKSKIEDLPGTPLKVLIKNNRFLSFYLEKRGDYFHIYFPFGSFMLTRIKKQEEKERKEEIGKIISPMSGKIIKVFKKEKEEVKENEPLCVIEAMKMQNEIKSKREGKIKKIFVEEGKIVKKGDILFVIE
ncbi:MAG: acetyl-CoA carboxylase biotin carboxyl carrier protein subunit [Candidatus Hydrothermales bacterium]